MALEFLGQAARFDLARVRMIVTDIDGTLLRSDKTISERTRAAIAAAQAAGIVFVVATGRMPRTMASIARAVGVQRWALGSNGAVIYDLVTDEIVAQFSIPPAVAREVILALRQGLPEIAFGCEAGLRFGCEPRYEELRPVARQQGTWRADALTLAQEPLTKLIVLHPSLSADTLLAEAQAIVGAAVTCTHSGLPMLEISAAGVDKGSGIAALCQRLGFAMDAVIACGDMPNDLAMLRRAGLGVAVANAHPDVLAAADAITASNDADGVALVLEQVVMTRERAV